MEKEYNSLLQNAIDRLPSQQRQVYYLIKDQGLKRIEVAHQLQIQPETVKFHLTQAMKNIRAFCMLHIGMFTGFTILLIGK
jgi:RNA polymerase sigma-70 factor (ECF subfamily)